MLTSGIIAIICATIAAAIKAYSGKDKGVTDVQTVLKEERNEAEEFNKPVPDESTVLNKLR